MWPSILLPQSEDSMKTYVKTGFSWNLLDTVVMGGLFSSTVLTLFLLPVLYEWVCANRRLCSGIPARCGVRNIIRFKDRGFLETAPRLSLTKNSESLKIPGLTEEGMMTANMNAKKLLGITIGLIVLFLLLPAVAGAHNVSKGDAKFVQANQGPAIAPFMYLGAKHMVTGYDHLLFLVGVIFFLYRLKDVVLYVSLFTIGHSTTLLSGVFAHIHANPYIVDAIIGFSVVYKAFDNMDGFKRLLGFQPNTKIAVLIFGLFHGFGLATKLQELALSQDGLVANIVSFNAGVEIGDIQVRFRGSNDICVIIGGVEY